MAIFLKKKRVFGNFLTFKWQFSRESAVQYSIIWCYHIQVCNSNLILKISQNYYCKLRKLLKSWKTFSDMEINSILWLRPLNTNNERLEWMEYKSHKSPVCGRNLTFRDTRIYLESQHSRVTSEKPEINIDIQKLTLTIHKVWFYF